MQRRLLAYSIVLAVSVACAPTGGEDPPPFVVQLIERYEAGPTASSPGSIWKYRYRGEMVFYVPPACCDVPSELYDGTGNVICGPDGGLTGDGDGKCPDFFEQRTDGVRIWRDSRTSAPR